MRTRPILLLLALTAVLFVAAIGTTVARISARN